ncbi:MAG: hypothetical protein KBF66_03175 [Rhodoferax sp.]|uniref:hypothetical protein n=1 Tax=Rhodoferax sp. TaxID=50421 RepID=UPI001B6310E3|nr:hypothetical protein [Rhodoferax sp.]MBP9904533.1 hypothetical protein [Rhodoferax sp.]
MNTSTFAAPRVAASPHPACFDNTRQYLQWRKYAVRSRVGESDFCTDCTRAYQHQMIKQCRCAHAHTRFSVDCDGFAQGRHPVSERLVHLKRKGRR